MKGYGTLDTIKNFYCLILTKLIWRNARLIRRPICIRNRKNIEVQEGFTCGRYCRLNPSVNGVLIIGKDFTMGDQCQIEAMEKVTIGHFVLLASKVYIGDGSHGIYSGDNQSNPQQKPQERKVYTQPIYIGDRVWIGNNASILGGVTIGSGSIIGAGSVVTHDIPENSIAAGVPARVIKQFNMNTGRWERNSRGDNEE